MEPKRKDVRKLRLLKIKQTLMDDAATNQEYQYSILLALTEIIESLPFNFK